MKTRSAPLLLSTGLAGLLTLSAGVEASELKIIASGALKAMAQLQPAYEKASGNTLSISWGPSMGDSPESIPSESNTRAYGLGHHGQRDPGSTGTYRCFRHEHSPRNRRLPYRHRRTKGHPHLDVSTVSALRAALLSSDKIAYSQGASGVYIRTELFARLGITDSVKHKTVEIQGKELVGTALARGDADIGMQQISELKVTPWIT